jgi:diguanylate cyclase (GGDEF)-like protein/PAS domain S-box-containing protein
VAESTMPEVLKVLLAEDSERDALLVLRELKREGFECESRRIKTESDLRRELHEFRPQIVLSDFSMPPFDGIAALRVCRELAADIPFIFVSGTIGENVAVDAMKAGANDYVMKTNLIRLGPAVRRELREAEARRGRGVTEGALRRAQVMARLAHVITDADGSMISWSDTLHQLAGVEPDRLPRTTRGWMDLMHADDRPRFREAAIRAGVERRRVEVEYRLQRPDGTYVHVRQDTEPLQEAAASDGSTRWFHTLQDVTEQKKAEEKIRGLNRVYAVLSGINTLIVRVRDRDELCRGVCRIALEEGKLPLAWIGVFNKADSRVEIAAWEGNGEGFIDRLPVLLDDEVQRGRGLARRAIKEAKAMVANDIATDERVALSEEAMARGFRSLAVLPLLSAGATIGVVCLFAEQAGFFDDEEMKLLLELARNISFAFEHIGKTERLDYLAYYDELTGLANRTLFHERLSQHVSAASLGQRRLAVVLMDIERFKTINDTLGRQAGDALLKQVAERMTRHAGDPAWLARIGADHFAVVVPDVQGEDEFARRTERRLQEFFGEPFPVGDSKLRISIKAGIAMYPSDGADGETLFKHAEAALKKAKASGDRFLFFTQEMTDRVAGKLVLENKLRQAIEKEEFVLYYQPKVDLGTRAVVGVEALIRWQSPDKGLVPPFQFIPLLEETGLILQVGAWALNRAARDHRAWTEQGLKPPRVAVNVSAIQLRQRDFVGVVEQAIIDGVAPTGIDLEITESLVMEDIKLNIGKLKALRALGVNIAIDDFGTGYSSLGYLAQLPVQSLKIDRSFIIKMGEDPNAMTLVSTIISLAHSLRLKVIAEGVETEEQAKFLRLLRCDEMQGYLFSKPVPEKQLVALLSQQP